MMVQYTSTTGQVWQNLSFSSSVKWFAIQALNRCLALWNTHGLGGGCTSECRRNVLDMSIWSNNGWLKS